MLITKTKLNYPITVEEAKRHARLDMSYDDDNDIIETNIKVATQFCENIVNFDIAKTQNVYIEYEFSSDFIRLKVPNIRRDSSINIQNDSSTYFSIKQTESFYNCLDIELVDTVIADPIYVTFTTGYDEDCPEIIKQAILLKTCDLYDTERNSWHSTAIRDDKTFETMLNYYKSYIV